MYATFAGARMTIAPTNATRKRSAVRLRSARRKRGFRIAKRFAQRLGVEQNTDTRYDRAKLEPGIAIIL
jgi:transcriptional regulator with XRE-family HTH domain